MEAKEGETVTLTCEYSLPGVQFHWRKGVESIRNGDKYVMKQRKTINSLTIKALKPEDSGEYTCQCRDHRTTASLKVQSMSLTFPYLHTLFYKELVCMQVIVIMFVVHSFNKPHFHKSVFESQFSIFCDSVVVL